MKFDTVDLTEFWLQNDSRVHKDQELDLLFGRQRGEAEKKKERKMTARPDTVEITEGSATIQFPSANEVFYNPVQQYNRDISIAIIKTWSEISRQEAAKKAAAKDVGENSTAAKWAPKKIKILEALSASGLRSIRYAKEIGSDLVDSIVANDLSEDAVESIRRNTEFNKVPPGMINASWADACTLLYEHRPHANNFDVIDIDPYGSAVPFIDGAVQAVSEGGLLCITCTDLAVLAGSYPETCFGKYGGVPIRGDACHEMAVRLLLHTIQTSAGRYKRCIIPLASMSIDFYIRVFVRVVNSPILVKSVASNTSTVLRCVGCQTIHCIPMGRKETKDKGKIKYCFPKITPGVGDLCSECNHSFHIAGPAWTGEMHNQEFLKQLLLNLGKPEAASQYETHKRMLGMITVMQEELQEAPFLYSYASLSSVVRCTTINMLKLNSALLNAGFKVSSSHCHLNSFKTNAPTHVIWDIFRAWAKQVGVKAEYQIEGSPARAILSKLPTNPDLVVNFEPHPNANPVSRQVKLVRFEDHKGKNWGPKTRAKKRCV